MKLPWVVQFSSLLLCGISVVGTASGQPTSDRLPTEMSSPNGVPSGSVRAFPSLHQQGGVELTYVGTFTPDAFFHKPPRPAGKGSHFRGGNPTPEMTHAIDDVPPSMVIAVERVADDPEPPAHAQQAAQVRSVPATLRNHFLAYLYGHPKVLDVPRRITSDSHHRLIVSDPAGGSIHVLDPEGNASFRIVCSNGSRLRQPQGVAVDADDNIYVADSERGFIYVFDPRGNFIRKLGDFHGEPEFVGPHGIAIDRIAKRLYLSDTPRNVIAVLNLDGRIPSELGRRHDGSGEVEFESPTDIAINHGQLNKGTFLMAVDIKVD